ncbi:MAG: glycosyltransferase family 1 protein [Elusimicrobiota bacterium]
MKITLDCSSLLFKSWSGATRYVRELTEHLLTIDDKNDYNLFFYIWESGRRKQLNVIRDQFKDYHASFKTMLIPQRVLEFIWNNMGLNIVPLDGLIGDSDVFHATGPRVPNLKKSKLITTIHDLTRIRLTEQIPENIRRHFISKAKHAIERSNIILTDSENSKKDLVDLLKVSENKVRTVHLGINRIFRQINDRTAIDECKIKLGIDSPYLFCVATSLGGNKNLPALLRTFKIFKDKYKTNHKLVVTGAIFSDFGEIAKLADSFGIKDNIVFTGHVSDDDLVRLYNGADVFVFLSLYEGFGLPVLEAMACGLPVVCSNTSSLPEIAGDAAVLHNPDNHDAVAESIYKILNDTGYRQNLIANGLERAKLFTWERCAQNTLNVYKEFSR